MVTIPAVAMRYGWLGPPTEESKRPVGCATETWMLWLGAGGMFACAFLRVYRSHSVLLWHNGFMWPVPLQLGITIMPFVLTPAALNSGADALVFDEETNECERDSEMPEAIVVGFMALLAAATAALTCRLQAVRFQDRMKVRTFASSPEGRNMPEFLAMTSFFSDSLDRECVRDYFLLQASTLRILDRYIREGAPVTIPLSSCCRDEMLTSKASSAFIFETARQEVMARMGGGGLTYRQQKQQKLPPGAFPAKAQPTRGTKTAGRAAVSGGDIKRHGLGILGGRTSDLLAVFGLRPDGKLGIESEENTPRGTLHGLRFALSVEDGKSGEGQYPFDQDGRPRQGEEAAPGSLDDLDPYMDLQGDLDFNYSESLASIAQLENDTGLHSGSSSEGQDGTSDEDDEDGPSGEGDDDQDGHVHQSDEDDEDGEVIVVVNPLFADQGIKRASR
ncbi:unnamed protein product [Ectocarpus sp. CCAP 1310/34]|nr:unnamed protein product [Ectocarpus sp. CCAP 1310/34]